MKTVLAAATILLLSTSAPAQDLFKDRLNKSPRHHEWVKVKNGDRTVHCFVVYPEVKDKATAVLVIHENKGLTDWVRSVADQLAEAGYIAIAPDMLSGLGLKNGDTADFKNEKDATQALYKLPQAQVNGDLNAAADYVIKLPACNGKLICAGFCWGGGNTLRFATLRSDLKAAFVFYGAFMHTKDDLKKIACPVYGFYGENDARINAALPETEAQMKDLGKTFEKSIYPGAGHGFMRSGDDPTGMEANIKGRNAAWERWKTLLRRI
jgi:carboxymethylenebutenolidase